MRHGTFSGRKIALISVLFLALPGWSFFAQELPFAHFTPEHNADVLTSASVQVVYQDRLRYIWFGFYSSGLARYNGSSVESYSMADGLPDQTVREVTEDASGRLWVGCDTGLVASELPLSEYGPGQRIRFLSVFDGTPIVQTRIRRSNLANDSFGWLWASTTGDGVFGYRFDQKGSLSERWIGASSSPEGSQQTVNAMLHRRNGSLWVALNNGSILEYETAESTAPVRTGTLSGPGELPAMAFHESPAGVVWGGSADGTIWYMDESKGVPVVVNTSFDSYVVSITESEEGRIWAASLGSGVVSFDPAHPEEAEHITRDNGLLGNTLWKLEFDHEGSLWFGQNGGVSRLRNNFRAFTNYSATTLRDDGAFAVLPRSTNSNRWIFLGTSGGLAVIDESSKVRNLTIEDGLTNNTVYALDIDQSGRIWVGTVGGINVLSPFPVEEVGSADGPTTTISIFDKSFVVKSFPFSVVYDVVAMPLAQPEPSSPFVDSVWIAGNGGLSVFNGNRRHDFDSRDGLPSTGSTSVAMDSAGFVWVATSDSGLFRTVRPLDWETLLNRSRDESIFEPVWNVQTGAPTNGIRNLLWASDRLWVGTSAGLAVIRVDPFSVETILKRSNGLGGDVVIGSAYSSVEGLIWVSQNEGLAAVDPSSMTVTRHVSKGDGLLENEAWAYGPTIVDDKGRVHLATPKGLAIYDPRLDVASIASPTVRIERADFREVGFWGSNEILLEYAALSFANEKAVRYQTRLRGFDDNWSSPTRSTSIRYTNLGAFLFPRKYTFEVLASNADGIWTAEAHRHEFRVFPPLWRRWWAAIAYILVLTALIVIYNRYRSSHLASRNRELQRLVAERTREIRSQAMEIETIDRIVQVINKEVDLDRVLKALLEQGMILFPQAEKGVALVIDNERNTSSVVAVLGYENELFENLQLTPEEARSRYAKSGEEIQEGVFLVRDFENLAAAEKTSHLPIPATMLAMDVRLGGRLEAFLIFDNFSDANAFKSSDVRKLARYREHAVTAIAKAKFLSELEIKNREAEQASEAKSRFLANMSHELRTPLNSIIGFSELLVERLENDLSDRYLHFLKLILSSGQHLLNIINDILDLSKVEAGRMEFFPEKFEIRIILENVRQIMRTLSTRQNVTIDLDCPTTLPPIETDPGKFKQIFYNLISNAVKFSPKNSVVRVVARYEAGERDGTGTFLIEVIDRGLGISHENLNLIFDEFRQIDGTAARKFEGTGLGLALVKRFVEALGGTVRVESEVAVGSTFSITLPERFTHRTSVDLAGPYGALLEKPQIKILVVEDESQAYEGLRRDFEAMGLLPIRAHHAEEAIRLARLIDPSAITLDIILPDVDGWEVLKQLKQGEETRKIPVVIVSRTRNQELGLALGADDYFVKPVDGKLLALRLSQLVRPDERAQRSVLLIDDDPAVRVLLEETLELEGYSLDYASTGRTGVETAKKTSPAMIILDLLMPEMSGFEVAAALREDDVTKDIPIIVLTAKDLTSEERDFLASNIAAIMTKGPAIGRELVTSIYDLIARGVTNPGS